MKRGDEELPCHVPQQDHRSTFSNFFIETHAASTVMIQYKISPVNKTASFTPRFSGSGEAIGAANGMCRIKIKSAMSANCTDEEITNGTPTLFGSEKCNGKNTRLNAPKTSAPNPQKARFALFPARFINTVCGKNRCFRTMQRAVKSNNVHWNITATMTLARATSLFLTGSEQVNAKSPFSRAAKERKNTDNPEKKKMTS